MELQGLLQLFAWQVPFALLPASPSLRIPRHHQLSQKLRSISSQLSQEKARAHSRGHRFRRPPLPGDPFPPIRWLPPTSCRRDTRSIWQSSHGGFSQEPPPGPPACHGSALLSSVPCCQLRWTRSGVGFGRSGRAEGVLHETHGAQSARTGPMECCLFLLQLGDGIRIFTDGCGVDAFSRPKAAEDRFPAAIYERAPPGGWPSIWRRQCHRATSSINQLGGRIAFVPDGIVGLCVYTAPHRCSPETGVQADAPKTSSRGMIARRGGHMTCLASYVFERTRTRDVQVHGKRKDEEGAREVNRMRSRGGRRRRPIFRPPSSRTCTSRTPALPWPCPSEEQGGRSAGGGRLFFPLSRRPPSWASSSGLPSTPSRRPHRGSWTTAAARGGGSPGGDCSWDCRELPTWWSGGPVDESENYSGRSVGGR